MPILCHAARILRYPNLVIRWIVEKTDSFGDSAVTRGTAHSRVNSFREAIQQFEEKDKSEASNWPLQDADPPAFPTSRAKSFCLRRRACTFPFNLSYSRRSVLIEKYPINYLSSQFDAVYPEKRKAKAS